MFKILIFYVLLYYFKIYDVIYSIGFSNESIRIERSETAFKHVEEAYDEIKQFYKESSHLDNIIALLNGKILIRNICELIIIIFNIHICINIITKWCIRIQKRNKIQ